MPTRSSDQSPVRPLSEHPESRLPSSSEGPELDRPGIEQIQAIVRDSLTVLRRDRVWLLRIFAALAALLTLAILLQTPLYESSSLMLVKFGRELVYVAEIGQERSIVSQDKAAVINSELAIMRSQPVIMGVVEEVGVSVIFPGLADAEAEAIATDRENGNDDQLRLLTTSAAERLRLALATQALPEADVIQVSYQHEDPVVAAETVNALVDRFLDAHLRAFAEPEVVNFLEGRVADFDERLTESERALLEFETSHPAFSLETPQSALVQQRDETRAALAEIDNQMATIRLKHLQEDASVTEARNQLLALEVEASRLQGRLQQEARQQISVIRRFIARRKAEIEGELEALQERRTALEETVATIDDELAHMPTLSAQYRRLVLQRDGDEEQYQTYSKRLRDARLSGEMDRERLASINVIQPASPAPNPSWPPSKPLSIAIAWILAGVAAVLAVILLDRLNRGGWVSGPRDPEAAG